MIWGSLKVYADCNPYTRYKTIQTQYYHRVIYNHIKRMFNNKRAAILT